MDHTPSAPAYLCKENKAPKQTQYSKPTKNIPLPIRANNPESCTYAEVARRRTPEVAPINITPLTANALLRLEVEEWDKARQRQQRRPSNLPGGYSCRVNEWVRQIQTLHERNELLPPPEHQMVPSTIENYRLV
ncbi:hypothetical protein FBEOM_5942 [Fusarium beomiforme]|uniref:Uncharacterized protein n=1 Tax=Fusarium beomiforme TaxID=44412 RepID=A0A9P5AJW8_9HYPO|nr:hypothetical protein FBEOM_5942 [Fusarium beomiforme]